MGASADAMRPVSHLCLQKIRLCLQNIPLDLQSLKLINCYLLLWSARQRLFTVCVAFASLFRTSAQLRLENIALRQQLMVLRRSAPKRLKLTPTDRIFWVLLRRVWCEWKSALMIVKAETVVAWHAKGSACSGHRRYIAASRVGPKWRKRSEI